jgi:hypothetical protein
MVSRNHNISDEEWNELVALKNAINYDPSTVIPTKMERFTELLVKTLQGKGDTHTPKN